MRALTLILLTVSACFSEEMPAATDDEGDSSSGGGSTAAASSTSSWSSSSGGGSGEASTAVEDGGPTEAGTDAGSSTGGTEGAVEATGEASEGSTGWTSSGSESGSSSTGDPAPEQGDCAHSLCTAGDPLAAGCDGEQACVQAICAVDPYCCDTFWGAGCVAKVPLECELACP